MTGILQGVRVIEVAEWWFVPAAGAILSDWGADVIKIERPGTGDAHRGVMSALHLPSGAVNFMWEQPNRGKRSVGIDLTTDDGLKLLYELVKGADVFLTSFLPGTRAGLRIDVNDIRAENQDIVYGRGHGLGSKGEEADKGGYDGASFWARSGVGERHMAPGGDSPVNVRPAMGDSISAMALAGGIAAALLSRSNTGVAPVVDVSLLATGVWTIGADVTAAAAMPGGYPLMDRHNPINPVVNFYPTKDGQWLWLNLIQADRFWGDLCERIDRPDMAVDPRFADMKARSEHRKECLAELEEAFRKRTLAEWRDELATMEAVWSPLQSPSEVLKDPQVIANGYVQDVDYGNLKQTLVGNPVQFDENAPQLRPAPELGQHTEEILLELGLTWNSISGLKESGAIS